MQLQGHWLPPQIFSVSVPLIVQSYRSGNKFSHLTQTVGTAGSDADADPGGEISRCPLRYDEVVAGKNMGGQAGKFVKHVLPAAVKPVHSLWHEVLGFCFLVVAGIAGFNVVRHRDTMTPGKLALILPLIVVTAAYGVSSFLKARRISRS